jgi:hypothetical protein
MAESTTASPATHMRRRYHRHRINRNRAACTAAAELYKGELHGRKSGATIGRRYAAPPMTDQLTTTGTYVRLLSA